MFIYIHLPFCLSHCIYCDFYVELRGTEDRRAAYLTALNQEIAYYLSQQNNEPIETLYFGGGTPGLFTAAELKTVLENIGQYAVFSADAEITLEANPEGMASDPAAYLDIGVNRLSIGVQSLQPNELKRLSRVHSKDTALMFLDTVQAAGFNNCSIDLMYGIPEQTFETWQDTLRQVAELPLSHISLYGLKVEPQTAMDKLLLQGRMTLPPEDDTVDMYLEAVAFLETQGFTLYEISNFAQPGRASRHNLVYWDNHPFWGFGVSAHGYIDHIRYENPRDLAAYCANPAARIESHLCSVEEQLENALIFGLRKREGVNLTQLNQQYQTDVMTHYGPAIERFFAMDLLTLKNNQLQLTLAGIPVSNEILAEFIN